MSKCLFVDCYMLSYDASDKNCSCDNKGPFLIVRPISYKPGDYAWEGSYFQVLICCRDRLQLCLNKLFNGEDDSDDEDDLVERKKVEEEDKIKVLRINDIEDLSGTPKELIEYLKTLEWDCVIGNNLGDIKTVYKMKLSNGCYPFEEPSKFLTKHAEELKLKKLKTKK